MTHRNTIDGIKTGGASQFPRNSLAETCLLARRCPVYRRRDSSPGFRRELENLVCDGKGKGTSGRTARRKVPMRRPGADCSVVASKRGNARGAKGVGHPALDQQVNRQREEPIDWTEGGSLHCCGGTSRISREAYVRSCERLGVRFPGPTRRAGAIPGHSTRSSQDLPFGPALC